LIAAQSADEECEALMCEEADSFYYDELVKLIPIEKIGMSLADGKLVPEYSVCYMSYWIPIKTKKK
jgi:hypothetical protein